MIWANRGNADVLRLKLGSCRHTKRDGSGGVHIRMLGYRGAYIHMSGYRGAYFQMYRDRDV